MLKKQSSFQILRASPRSKELWKRMLNDTELSRLGSTSSTTTARPPPKSYDGEKLKSIVEAFAEPLTKHLYDEIETLRALDKYVSEKLRQAYRRFEKSLMATGNVRHVFLSANMRPLTSSSFELCLWSSVLLTGASRVGYTTSQLYRSLCLMSSTTYFVCDIVEHGASIQVQAGGIAGN